MHIVITTPHLGHTIAWAPAPWHAGGLEPGSDVPSWQQQPSERGTMEDGHLCCGHHFTGWDRGGEA